MLNLVRKHQPIRTRGFDAPVQPTATQHGVRHHGTIDCRAMVEGRVKWENCRCGRRPTFLHLNEDRAGIFGINVRPFTTNMVLANLAGNFLWQESIPTPATPDEFVKQITERVFAAKKKRPHMTYEGIGVSLPGRVDLSSQKFVFAPNLRWHDEDLKERLEQATGLPVDLENEANACALSEFWFGHHTGWRAQFDCRRGLRRHRRGHDFERTACPRALRSRR